MLLYLRVGNSQESFAKPPKGKPWCAQGPDAILMNSLERYGGESGTLWNQADNYNVLWLCRELLVQVTVSTGSLFLSAVLQRELHNPLLNIHTSDLFPSPPVCVSSTAGCWSHPLPPVNLISVALPGMPCLLQPRAVLHSAYVSPEPSFLTVIILCLFISASVVFPITHHWAGPRRNQELHVFSSPRSQPAEHSAEERDLDQWT